MIESFESVAAALDQGLTLPASWYSDPEVYALERERIFAQAWQYAGWAELVRDRGEYFTAFAGHVPVVVLRDADGELRGFVNVCRHRGHLVAQGRGKRESLQCPYHAWTYGLDGCLRAAPRSEREPGFDFEAYSLLPVAVETAGPFVFANPDPNADPLPEQLRRLPELLADGGLDVSALRFHERVEWDMDVNWKIGIENYLECYHCPVAHPSFSKLIDVDADAYLLSSEGLISTQLGPVRESALSSNGDGVPYVPRADSVRTQFHFVWPSLTINVEPGPPNMSVDVWRPVGPRRMESVSDYFFSEDATEKERQEIIDFGAQVGAEDVALVESVQRGLDSGMVPRGRLLLSSEHLIAHFQRLVLDSLANGSH